MSQTIPDIRGNSQTFQMSDGGNVILTVCFLQKRALLILTFLGFLRGCAEGAEKNKIPLLLQKQTYEK